MWKVSENFYYTTQVLQFLTALNALGITPEKIKIITTPNNSIIIYYFE